MRNFLALNDIMRGMKSFSSHFAASFSPSRVASSAFALAVAALALPSASHADVSWEHRISVRMGKSKKPLFTAKMYNDWSGRKQRTMFSVASNAFGGALNMPGAIPTVQTWSGLSALGGAGVYKIPSSPKTNGPIQAAIIYDLEADRYISYATPTRQYTSEAWTPLLKRLRFDPWKKAAPGLSQGETPSLTPEQRERLGAEVRATYSAWLKKVVKMYFRPLSETRTFNGIEGHGYRMTWLMNVGATKAPQWIRFNAEWWLGNDLQGDEEVRAFQNDSRALLKTAGWPSTSMWINEMAPVMWRMMPTSLHESLETLMPPAGSPREGFGGTPLVMHFTVVPPALARASMGGDFHADIELASRSTNAVPERVFQAPAGYKKIDSEPVYKQYDAVMNQIAEMINGKVPDFSKIPGLPGMPGFPGMGMPGMPSL